MITVTKRLELWLCSVDEVCHLALSSHTPLGCTSGGLHSLPTPADKAAASPQAHACGSHHRQGKAEQELQTAHIRSYLARGISLGNQAGLVYDQLRSLGAAYA